jgi:hypothetical protein
VSRRSLEGIFFDVDSVRLLADKYGDVLKAVLDEGGKRPVLTTEEYDSLYDGLTDVQIKIQQALEALGKERTK